MTSITLAVIWMERARLAQESALHTARLHSPRALSGHRKVSVHGQTAWPRQEAWTRAQLGCVWGETVPSPSSYPAVYREKTNSEEGRQNMTQARMETLPTFWLKYIFSRDTAWSPSRIKHTEIKIVPWTQPWRKLAWLHLWWDITVYLLVFKSSKAHELKRRTSSA